MLVTSAAGLILAALLALAAQAAMTYRRGSASALRIIEVKEAGQMTETAAPRQHPPGVVGHRGYRATRSLYGGDGMIVCDQLVRIYSGEGIEVQALQGLDLLIAEGELTALIGAAGSGKSTLMNILAGLDTPTAGAVWVAGHNLGAMTAKDRLAYRRSTVGFIWQQASRNLLPYMTARQNVVLPMRFSRLAPP